MKQQRRKHIESDPIKDIVIHRQDPTARRVYEKETKAPTTQVFTDESLKGEDINKKYCVECGGSLVRFPSCFSCNSCGLSIEDKADSKVPASDLLLSSPAQDIAPPGSQVNDNNADDYFIASFGPENQYEDNKPYEVVQESGRFVHIRCKGNIADALAAQKEYDDSSEES